MVAPRIRHDQGTPLYDRGIDDMDTVGLVEKAGEDAGRRERANEFMASLAPDRGHLSRV